MRSLIKNVVIMDDLESKRSSIKSYLQEILQDAKFMDFGSLSSGLYHLHNSANEDILLNPNHWLIVTDMCMPLYDEPSRMIERAGERVLREMSRLEFMCPVIVESSDVLDDLRLAKLYMAYLGSVVESPRFDNLAKYEELLQDYLLA